MSWEAIAVVIGLLFVPRITIACILWHYDHELLALIAFIVALLEDELDL